MTRTKSTLLNTDRWFDGIARTRLMTGQTPLERLERLSDLLGIELWLKRDDLTGLGFGGNKTRQLEFYFGEALAQGADTVLITGAVQSNFVRSAAAGAARLGLKAVLQLEERVSGMGETYHRSGNVLLAQILGAEHMSYPLGEDESGADECHSSGRRSPTTRCAGLCRVRRRIMRTTRQLRCGCRSVW